MCRPQEQVCKTHCIATSFPGLCSTLTCLCSTLPCLCSTLTAFACSHCRYNARPHWGKNFDRTFTHPKCPIRPKYPEFAKQLASQKRYDPAGMYQPALFDKVRWQPFFQKCSEARAGIPGVTY
jgi:hypothetical protein